MSDLQFHLQSHVGTEMYSKRLEHVGISRKSWDTENISRKMAVQWRKRIIVVSNGGPIKVRIFACYYVRVLAFVQFTYRSSKIVFLTYSIWREQFRVKNILQANHIPIQVLATKSKKNSMWKKQVSITMRTSKSCLMQLNFRKMKCWHTYKEELPAACQRCSPKQVILCQRCRCSKVLTLANHPWSQRNWLLPCAHCDS